MANAKRDTAWVDHGGNIDGKEEDLDMNYFSINWEGIKCIKVDQSL